MNSKKTQVPNPITLERPFVSSSRENAENPYDLVEDVLSTSYHYNLGEVLDRDTILSRTPRAARDTTTRGTCPCLVYVSAQDRGKVVRRSVPTEAWIEPERNRSTKFSPSSRRCQYTPYVIDIFCIKRTRPLFSPQVPLFPDHLHHRWKPSFPPLTPPLIPPT